MNREERIQQLCFLTLMIVILCFVPFSVGFIVFSATLSIIIAFLFCVATWFVMVYISIEAANWLGL